MNTKAKSRLRACLASFLVVALVFGCPGIGSYQAFAAGLANPSVAGAKGVPPLQIKVGVGHSGSVSLLQPQMGELPKLLDWQRPVAIEVGMQDRPAVVFLEKSAEIPSIGQVPVTSLESLKAGQAQVVKVLDSPAKAVDVSRIFFDGQAKTADAVTGSSVDADPNQGNPVVLSKASALRRISKTRVGVYAGAATVIAGIGIHGVLAYASPTGLSWMAVVDKIGLLAYCVGNTLATVFSIPQIYKSFRLGAEADTPVASALGGGASGFALGFINAPLDGNLLWGLQNLCGGSLLLMAPLALERFMARQKDRLSRFAAGACTAVTSAALFAVSWALYEGAATLVIPMLTSWLGPGIQNLALAVQVIAGIGCLAIFSPGIKAVLRKESPKGFTSLLSLFFFVSAVCFFIWTLQQVLHAEGSAGLLRWICYALQSVIYAVVAMMSYVFARRQERKSGSGA